MDTEAELVRLTEAFFAAVSFEPGAQPGYDAIRDLFIPAGMLIRNTGDAPEPTTVDEFIAPRAELFASGALTEFYEGELEGVNQVFGTVAHRWCSYEKRGLQNGTAFSAVGAISTQFVLTPDGWRMSSMAWDDER